MGLAFLDVQIYVTSIRVFKNLILISDALKSVWFVSFQEDPYKFTIIGKDLQQVSVMTGDFLVHDGQATFITSDKDGDMRMIDYDPTREHSSLVFDCPELITSCLDPDALNGERLILKTEFHTGSATTVSKEIARRRIAEEEFAPQTQIVHGMSSSPESRAY